MNFFNLGAYTQLLISQKAIAQAEHERRLRDIDAARRVFEDCYADIQRHKWRRTNQTKWGQAEDAEIIEPEPLALESSKDA